MLLSREKFARTMRELSLLPHQLYGVGGEGVESQDILLPSPREAEAGAATRADLFFVTCGAAERIAEIVGYSPIVTLEQRVPEPCFVLGGQPQLLDFGVGFVHSAGILSQQLLGEAEVGYEDNDGDGEIDNARVDLSPLLIDISPPNPGDLEFYAIAVPDRMRTDGTVGLVGEWVIDDEYRSGYPLPAPLFVNPALQVGQTEPLPPVVSTFITTVEVYRLLLTPTFTVVDGRRAKPNPSYCQLPTIPWVRHGRNALLALAKCAAADLPLRLCVRGVAADVFARLQTDMLLEEKVRVPGLPPLGTRLGHYESYQLLKGG